MGCGQSLRAKREAKGGGRTCRVFGSSGDRAKRKGSPGSTPGRSVGTDAQSRAPWNTLLQREHPDGVSSRWPLPRIARRALNPRSRRCPPPVVSSAPRWAQAPAFLFQVLAWPRPTRASNRTLRGSPRSSDAPSRPALPVVVANQWPPSTSSGQNNGVSLNPSSSAPATPDPSARPAHSPAQRPRPAHSSPPPLPLRRGAVSPGPWALPLASPSPWDPPHTAAQGPPPARSAVLRVH